MTNQIHRSAPGYSLIELLVSIGVLAVLLGLALPVLAPVRSQARLVTTLSNAGQIAQAVNSYADAHDGKPPVIFEPVYVNEDIGFQSVETRLGRLRGGWFDNSYHFNVELDPLLSGTVLVDPASPIAREPEGEGVRQRNPHFKLSDSLYATPDYWDRQTQRGPEQWKVQRIGLFQFPAQKGFVKQAATFTIEGFETFPYPTCCVSGVFSAVVWADLSASREDQSTLRPGVPNFWHHGRVTPPPIWADGAPIDDTQDGILGYDR